MSLYARIVDGRVVELIELATAPSRVFSGALEFVSATASVRVGWVYANGAFSAPPAPADTAWPALQYRARLALDASDRTVLRCVEAGVPLPPAWAAYRQALRVIVGATTPSSAGLPTRPDFPAGT